MLEARLEQANLLKRVIEAIKDLVTDCNLDCNDTGLALQAMDLSHVALVSLVLRSDSFAPYRCDRNLALGVNLISLTKVLRAAHNDDILTLRAQDAPDTLNLVFEATDADRISEYHLKLMDIDQEHLGIPEAEHAAVVILPSTEFQRITRDLSAMSESVTIEVNKEGVTFASSGDIGSGAIKLRSHSNVDKPELDVSIVMSEPVSLTFSLQYLNNFTKATALSNQVKLGLDDNTPLMIEYGLANGSHLRYYLAPKIGETE